MRLCFSLSILGLLLFTSCTEEGTSSPVRGPASAVPVRIAPVEKRELFDETIAIGTLRSQESVDVSSSVTERVESLHFDDGQEVKKGQLLAQLANEEEAAAIQIADAELAEERREVARLEVLAERDAVAEVTLDERRTRSEIAIARLARMQAMLDDRRIVAPFDGVVGLRRISPGAMAEPGTIITTIDQIDPMKLDFQVPEVFLTKLETGTKLQARSAAFEGETFDATVSMVDSRVDPVTRSIAVRALIPNPEKRLHPGMLMTVELKRNQREAIVIPERAIVPVGSTQSVYLLNDGTVSLVEVTTGARIPGYVEILEGLTEGRQVVTDGVLSLKDGSEVTVAGQFEGTTPPFDPTADPVP
ncbi:MAG: efflux RND transporter periplasmic adaptor subunit [Verrucomicrobiales bacterium]|nr:efflux RND transporter periplasmic adaptor subunit [Verrucomicrobiales bacterium]